MAHRTYSPGTCISIGRLVAPVVVQFGQDAVGRPPLVITPKADQARLDAVREFGGVANPYTFIPTPPRKGLPPELDDGPPAPHGFCRSGDAVVGMAGAAAGDPD